MNRLEDFIKYRNQYPDFIYRSYKLEELDDCYQVTYTFEIPGLTEFYPSFSYAKEIVKNNDFDYINDFIFHIGLIELLSYWKCTCSPNIKIEAGYLNENEIAWFSHLYQNGLGEFLYTNGIFETDLFTITCSGKKVELPHILFEGTGNLIPVGGGKDSNLTLDLLKGEDNTCFVLNPKAVQEECIKISGYDSYIAVKRVIDQNLLELNKQGYLNGHTPFSALVAFLTYFIAYLNNKQYIVLSNESSANEATVLGTNINHQYSKTFEFEKNFMNYMTEHFNLPIMYFSLLRPLSEYQIAMLFSELKTYHSIFHSCNVGSKGKSWHWCCNCSKCLFVYIILSPFLYQEELVSIFGEDLYENKELLPIFLELLGKTEVKPFECVGSVQEVNYAVSQTIRKHRGNLPYLLNYFNEHYQLVDGDLEHEYQTVHQVPPHFEEIIKRRLDVYDRKYYSETTK